LANFLNVVDVKLTSEIILYFSFVTKFVIDLELKSMVFDFLFIKDKTESCEFNSVGFGSWLSCFGSFSSSSNGAPNVFLILFI